MKLVAIAFAAALATSPAYALPWETFSEDDGWFVGAFQDDDSKQFQLEVNCDGYFGETEVLIRSRNDQPLVIDAADVGTVYFSIAGQSISTDSFAFPKDSTKRISALGFDDLEFVAALRTAMTSERDLDVDFLGYRATFSGENAAAAFSYVDANC